MTDKERADQLAAENADLKAKQATAAADAIKADRERRSAIMALEEAKGREPLAEQLYAADMTAEQAKPILAAAAKAPAKTDAEMHEERRLNGEGLNGGKPAPTAAKVDLVAVMKKQLGVKEAV